jgi:hypothetical protein
MFQKISVLYFVTVPNMKKMQILYYGMYSEISFVSFVSLDGGKISVKNYHVIL